MFLLNFTNFSFLRFWFERTRSFCRSVLSDRFFFAVFSGVGRLAGYRCTSLLLFATRLLSSVLLRHLALFLLPVSFSSLLFELRAVCPVYRFVDTGVLETVASFGFIVYEISLVYAVSSAVLVRVVLCSYWCVSRLRLRTNTESLFTS